MATLLNFYKWSELIFLFKMFSTISTFKDLVLLEILCQAVYWHLIFLFFSAIIQNYFEFHIHMYLCWLQLLLWFHEFSILQRGFFLRIYVSNLSKLFFINSMKTELYQWSIIFACFWVGQTFSRILSLNIYKFATCNNEQKLS